MLSKNHVTITFDSKSARVDYSVDNTAQLLLALTTMEALVCKETNQDIELIRQVIDQEKESLQARSVEEPDQVIIDSGDSTEEHN